jgi:2-amino-4-hydroxy-6-hydroxymethyldihydropteridine diphosphokinase
MILIALGANLPSKFGSPAQTIEAAYQVLAEKGVNIKSKSRIWLTAPVPFDADQDWYHNSVIEIDTDLSAHHLLDLMLKIEEEFGRVRTIKNAPRLLDLDLVAYHDEIIKDDERLIVPHPRMHERLFVLKPLEDISQDWTHPVSGQKLPDMLQNIPSDQEAKPLELSHD